MYKQLIIVRKDLNMSIGKTSAMVSHASMAFLTTALMQNSKKKNNFETYPTWDTKRNCPARYMRKDLDDWAREARENGEKYFYIREQENGTLERVLNVDDYHYEINMRFDRDIYEQWVGGIFTKIVCEAKNKNQLMKAVRIAEELGLKENKDFFIIRDCCLTELEPEEFDENGIGRTITCIGFAPMDTSIVEKISKKFQLLK